MPIGGGPSNGPFPGVAQLPIVWNTLTFAGAGTLTTAELHADNLPGLNVWLLQTVGPGAVTATVQFAQGWLPGLAPNWRPLVAPLAALVVGTPSLTNYRLGSFRYRVSLASTGVASVEYRVTASLT